MPSMSINILMAKMTLELMNDKQIVYQWINECIPLAIKSTNFCCVCTHVYIHMCTHTIDRVGIWVSNCEWNDTTGQMYTSEPQIYIQSLQVRKGQESAGK